MLFPALEKLPLTEDGDEIGFIYMGDPEADLKAFLKKWRQSHLAARNGPAKVKKLELSSSCVAPIAESLPMMTMTMSNCLWLFNRKFKLWTRRQLVTSVFEFWKFGATDISSSIIWMSCWGHWKLDCVKYQEFEQVAKVQQIIKTQWEARRFRVGEGPWWMWHELSIYIYIYISCPHSAAGSISESRKSRSTVRFSWAQSINHQQHALKRKISITKSHWWKSRIYQCIYQCKSI